MNHSFEYITTLEYRLKAANAEIQAFQSGKKYQQMEAEYQKENRFLERRIKKWRNMLMLTEKEIIDIANNYAKSSQTKYFSLQLLCSDKSKFLDGYWDVSFKVLDETGYEIDGPLLVAINGENGQISTMEEIIMKQKNKL